MKAMSSSTTAWQALGWTVGKQFSQNYRWSQKYVEWRILAGTALRHSG